MKSIFVLTIAILWFSLAGCTINFKSEKLELETKPLTPKNEFSGTSFVFESIALSSRKDISWP